MPGTTSPAYSNRLVTEGTPMVAGAMLVGLSGVYLTIKHIKEEAARERLEAEQEQAAQPAGRREITMLQKLLHELRTMPKFIYVLAAITRASGWASASTVCTPGWARPPT